MIPDWNGEQGRFWVQQQEHQDAVLEVFIPRLLDAAKIWPTDAILDIGCGCGATTRAAGRIAIEGRVLGADISEPMLARARDVAAAEGLARVEFVEADVQLYPFDEGSFDVAISRFGVMFFEDSPVAFANIARALRRGGRLAFVCWQPAKDNLHISLPMRAIVTAFPDALPRNTPQPPFSMADPDTVRRLLGATGFSDIEVEPVAGPLRVGADVDEVMHHFQAQPMAKGLLAAQDPAKVEQVLGQIRAQLQEHATPDGVHLGSAAWLVTARR